METRGIPKKWTILMEVVCQIARMLNIFVLNDYMYCWELIHILFFIFLIQNY